jgi:hypothetical protein
MKKTYYFLLFLLCFSVCNLLCAQETWTKGYILTKAGEKREGWIEYLSGDRVNEVCHFKAQENGPHEKYKPEEIQEYHFDQVKCVSRQFALASGKKEWVFAECIFESSKYGLFRYKKQYIVEDKGSNTEPFRFGFALREGENEALAPKDRKDEARLLALTHSLLTGQGVPVEKLSSSVPRVDRLKRILVDYHEANKIPFQTHQDLRSEPHFTFGWIEPFWLVGQPKIIKSDVFDEGSIKGAIQLGLNFPIHLSQHPTYNRFSIMILPGIRYLNYSQAQNINFRQTSFSSKETIAQAAFFGKYNLLRPGKNFQIGLYAGVNFHTVLSSQTNLVETYRDNSNQTVTLNRNVTSLTEPIEVNLMTGADLGYVLPNGSMIYAGLRNQYNPYAKNYLLGTKLVSLNIETLPISLYFGIRPKIRSGLLRLRQQN